MDPVILATARKHGVPDEDILHAYRNPVRVVRFDDLTMLIGPSTAGTFLEVGIVVGQEADFVVHAMTARHKFLR